MRKLIMEEMKKFDSNIFSGGMLLKGSTKTGSALSKEKERICSTCRNYKGNLKCRILGKIKNLDDIYCSWWKEKLEKKIETKRCNKCGELKTIDKFYKNKLSNDGYQYKCSDCAIKYGKEYQRNNYGNKNQKDQLQMI